MRLYSSLPSNPTPVRGPGVLPSDNPQVACRWRRLDLPGSWRTLVFVPCSQTPAGLQRQAVATSPCGLPHLVRRRLPRFGSFEAQSHGPNTRCLRFAAPVTRTPRKTRFRWLARPCRTGLATRRVPAKGFSSCILPSQAYPGANQTNPIHPFRKTTLKWNTRHCWATLVRPVPGNLS